ncbi:MAG: DUF2220 family protein, partial [Candidatus Symbiothrix sp.]|nr:DUF2220 family protein [Candidatus Symbiothrix sp.]
EYQSELKALLANSKEQKGFGYTVKYQTIRKKGIGTQDIPTEISFLTASDFLKYLYKEKEVDVFRKNILQILSTFPELKDWITKYPQKIIDNQDKWEDILKVCAYFKSEPAPNLYIRELPIQIHTKFIENNKSVIKELLDILIADFVKTEETNFEKRFNLKYSEPLVRFRILDTHISQTYFSGINDLSIPVSQFEQLRLPIKKVLIVENKTNLLTIALTLPEVEKTIVIFGSGYKVENLKNVEWFNQMKLFYWGDLDVQGFEILSQFRGYFPHTQSILMSEAVFKNFSDSIFEGTITKITTKLNLTEEEQQLYELLKANNWRLEQEKISTEYINQLIEKYLN